MKVSVIFITVDNNKNADKIVLELLRKRLVACVNKIENVKSMYWWKGKIEKAKEVLLIIKTTNKKIDEIIKTTKKIHPYTVPEIISFNINKGNEDYINWVLKETK